MTLLEKIEEIQQKILNYKFDGNGKYLWPLENWLYDLKTCFYYFEFENEITTKSFSNYYKQSLIDFKNLQYQNDKKTEIDIALIKQTTSTTIRFVKTLCEYYNETVLKMPITNEIKFIDKDFDSPEQFNKNKEFYF